MVLLEWWLISVVDRQIWCFTKLKPPQIHQPTATMKKDLDLPRILVDPNKKATTLLKSYLGVHGSDRSYVSKLV